MRLAVLAVFAVFWLSLAPPFDYDVWFDVRMGEQILTTHSVPHTESFLGTQEQFGEHWSPNDEWGFCVASYLIYRLGGPTGLAVAMAVGLAALFGVLWASCRRVGLPPWACGLWLGLGYQLMRSRFMPRPQLFTDLMLAVLVYWLLRGLKRPGLAFPFFVLWANMHAGFVAGLVVLGVWMVLARSKSAAIALGLGCLAPLLTPGSVKLYVYVYNHFLVRTRDMNVLLEWQPLGSEWLWGPGGIFAVIALLGFGLAVRERRLQPAHLALVGLMMLFAARHSRALGELVAVAMPLVAAAWAPRVRDSRALSVAVGVVLVVVVVARGVPDLASRGVYPTGALPFLQKVDGTVLASYHFGGWLTLQRVRPFLHGMQPTYPPDLLTDYLTILDDPEKAPELLAHYKVKALLLHYSPLNDAHTRFMQRLANDPAWSLVYWDDVCLLYLPSPQKEAYRAVAPALPDPFVGDLKRAEQELERQPPECATAWRLRAELANRQGEPARALELFQEMATRFPEDGRARLGAGATLFQMGQLPEAEAELRAAVRLQPRSATAHFNLALVLTRQGNMEARSEARKAVALDPNLPAAAELLRQLESVR